MPRSSAMPRILVLNPVSTDVWDDLTREYLGKIANPDTELVVRSLERGPVSIENEADVTEAAPYVVEEVAKAESEGFDCVVVNCFDDPGVWAARERAAILVMGIGETSMIAALNLGHKFAVISTGEKSRSVYDAKALKLGVRDRLAYASGIPVRVLDLRFDTERVKKHLLAEAKRAVEDYGAEVIVLGCGGMIGISMWLSRELGVPVVDPTPTTFKIAEALLAVGLKHSKRYLYSYQA